MTEPPAILYPVRPGESNDELRFSLRSVAMNLPHGPIWIVGYKPSWVTGVHYIPGGNTATWPRANLWHNILLACTHPDLPDDFLIMNDDIFFIGPHPEPIPVLYRGWLADQVGRATRRGGARGWWQESLASTLAVLQAAGITHPLSYELHVPFPTVKAAMADTLQRFADATPRNPPQWRSLYGNMHEIGGRRGEDGKSVRPGPIARPYHSTDDLSWRYFRTRFAHMFPDPCRYELPVAQPRTLAPRRVYRTARRARA